MALVKTNREVEQTSQLVALKHIYLSFITLCYWPLHNINTAGVDGSCSVCVCVCEYACACACIYKCRFIGKIHCLRVFPIALHFR